MVIYLWKSTLDYLITVQFSIKRSRSIHILSIQINTKSLDWLSTFATSNCPSLQERLTDVVRMLGILKYGYI